MGKESLPQRTACHTNDFDRVTSPLVPCPSLPSPSARSSVHGRSHHSKRPEIAQGEMILRQEDRLSVRCSEYGRKQSDCIARNLVGISQEGAMKESTMKESHRPRQAERSLPGPGSFDLAPRKVLVRSTSRYAPCTGPDKRGSPVHGMREERRSFIPTKGVCTGKSFVYIEQIRNLLSFACARVFRKGQVQNLCSPVQSNPVPQKVHESHFRRVSHAVFLLLNQPRLLHVSDL
jgi:hypothetical protein